jgi:hypothetical protein
MAARIDRSPDCSAHTRSRERMLAALYGCIALFTVLIGALGLLGASWLRQMLDTWINIHALFGLLLCGLVLARCRWRVRHSLPMLPADVRRISGHLSRTVYLLLYVVIAIRQVIGILDGVWHGRAVDFNLLDARFRTGPDYPGFNPKDDFQLFVASGLCALLFVRVLAFQLWSSAVQRTADLEPPAEISPASARARSV